MHRPAIRTVDLSKEYRIGELGASYDTLREHLVRVGHRIVHPGRERPAPKKIWALRDVTFDVRPGEVVGVIGRNGAGKTTLLRLLSRITDPTAGFAEIRGRIGSLLEVGTGFHPELTGRENIYLNGAILGMRRNEIRRKFDEIVEFSGVGTFIDTPVKRYSSGMYVRLAFAVAAHLDFETLLVDEVLAVGDAEFQRRSLGKMEDVSQAGRTVVFVSHNMPMIARLCERVLLLEGGRLVADGPTQTVISRYLQSEHGTASHRRWSPEEAPGNENVRLHSVRVVDRDLATAATIDVREPVGLELAFEVLRDGPEFVPWIALFNDQGTHIFSAMDIDPSWRTPRSPGTYTTTAWVPENLLNEGSIVVSVSLNTFIPGGSSIQQASARDVVSFQVHDPGEGDTARGHYGGAWTAPVRPLLQWTTEYSRSDVPAIGRVAP